MPILVGEEVFEQVPFEKESSFEETVENLSDAVFGAQSIYVGVKKKIRSGSIVGIPDAYVIDMTVPDDPRLWVIENEIVRHDPVKHVGPQLLKFVIGFQDDQVNIRSFLMHEITQDKAKLSRLESRAAVSNSRNIENYLDKAVFGEFRGAVLIDEARPELHRVLETIRANISVLEVKAFKSDSGKTVYQFDSLYEEEEDVTAMPQKSAPNTSDRLARRQRRAESDTIVVPARKDGFERVFLGQAQWYSIRIGAAMRDRLKYIAAYQVAPVSAVTHIAEIEEIRPFQDTGKFIVTFKSDAQEVGPIPIKDVNRSPQGPVYVRRERLLEAATLDDAMTVEVE